MAKGKQRTDTNMSAKESLGKKKAQRGLKSENNDKNIDEDVNGDVQNNNKKSLRKRRDDQNASNKHGRGKDHVEVDQKADDAEKQIKTRGRKQASKKTSHVPKDLCTSVSGQTVAEDESGKKEIFTDIEIDKNNSKLNVKVKKNQTMIAKKRDVKSTASKLRQKDSVDTKGRSNGKLGNKTELDEIDGDVETSEYFDSDSGRNQRENHQKRKRNYSGEKKTMSSKVKHLKTHIPDFELNKTSKVLLIQTKDDDSSNSDFEEVPDVTAQSTSTSHVLNIKRDTNKNGKKETFSKDDTSEKKSTEVKEKAKPEKNGIRGNKGGGKRRTDLKRKNDEGSMESEIKNSDKKRKQEIHSAEIEMKTKFTKSKSDSKTAEKTAVNKNKTDNSKHVKTEKRNPKQKDEVKHEQNLKKSIDNSDITALLLHMEGPGALVKPSTSYAKDDDEMMSDDDDNNDDDNSSDNGDDDDEEEGDWEDVEDHHGYHSPVKSQLPDKPVEITLDAPVIYKKRKKKEFDIKAYFQRQINKYKRELNISMHKVHLLCLLSRGFYLNNLCMDETLEAQGLSITMVTRELKIASVKSCDVNGLSYMIKWMKEAFPVKNSRDDQSDDLRERLECGFQQRSVTSRLEFVLVCVILLRQLGFLTRLVMSLQPIPIRTVPKKETNSGKKRSGNPAKIQKKIKEGDKSGHKKDQSGSKAMKQEKPSQKLANEKTKTATVSRNAKAKSDTEGKKTENKNKDVKADSAVKALNFEKCDKNDRTGSKKNGKDRTKNTKGTTDSKEDISNNRLQAKNKSRRSCASKIKRNAYVDNDGATDDVEDSEEDYVPGKEEKAVAADDDDYDSDIENGSGDDDAYEEDEKMTKMKNRQLKKEKIESSDSEFAEEIFQVRTQSLKKVTPTQKNKKALSTDSGEVNGASSGADEWMEVFLQKEQKWICIDCVTVKLAKPYAVEHNATPPVHYVVAFSEDGTIKDVTARYASQWLTTTRKFRGDEDWWGETVDLYKPVDRVRDEEENRDIQSHLLQRPLPTSIAAFKSHPLYALKRHLLKFEALYPETAVPLGYVRGEPVYARECVHVLHSRENWLKEGRAVRVGEEPYKHVKSRPKWNKPKENPDALDLEVFGRWQTEVYIPPPAVDGKVPRNAHGNVELFLPSMLPAGTVHLQIEGLNKVAKKLDIDCAPAMVGWDHHCGFSHPRMDGWIVCEEFKDILLAAWDEEQEIIREKEQEKREKRVYTNWKLLIKGLLIKERLKKRFDFEDEDKAKAKEKQPTTPTRDESQEIAEDYKHAWPQNRQKKHQEHFELEKL